MYDGEREAKHLLRKKFEKATSEQLADDLENNDRAYYSAPWRY